MKGNKEKTEKTELVLRSKRKEIRGNSDWLGHGTTRIPFSYSEHIVLTILKILVKAVHDRAKTAAVIEFPLNPSFAFDINFGRKQV